MDFFSQFMIYILLGMNEKKNNKKTIEKNIFYEKLKTYSITINLDNKHQAQINKNAFTKMVKCKDYIRDILDKYNHHIYYLLHLDISEPKELNNNKYPRMHFHGCIMFKSDEAILDWLLMVCPKLSAIAYVDIDTIDDLNIWEKYCKKYDHITNIQPLQNKLGWSID